MNDDFSINNNSYVTLTMMNDIFEIQYMEKSNFTNNIQIFKITILVGMHSIIKTEAVFHIDAR